MLKHGSPGINPYFAVIDFLVRNPPAGYFIQLLSVDLFDGLLANHNPFALGFVAGTLNQVKVLPVAMSVVRLDRKFRFVADAVGLEPHLPQNAGTAFGYDDK